VSHEEYDEAVAGAVEFLRGHSAPLVNTMKRRMKEASDSLDYERAAEYRDYIEAAESLNETQRVVLHHSNEADIIVRVGQGDKATDAFAVFSVRDGKLVDRETFSMDMSSSIDEDGASILEAFINQHYSRMPDVPREIIVAENPSGAEVLEQYLSEISAHSVKILKPERGEKKALLKLAVNDAAVLAESMDRRAKAEAARREELGGEIWDVLCAMEAEAGRYDGRQFRAEAYDISNTNGVDTVGAMVVYDGLKADRQSYRKFRVRTVEGQDDYASMREVLSRRFLRVFSGDDKFAVLPDIIFMDGGKGHVATALEVIESTGFEIPVAGMVKDDRHRTRGLIVRVPDAAGEDGKGAAGEDGFRWVEIPLADKPLLYKYIGTMQEEVHRFAITYHHKLRSKNLEHSVLDDIKGIGPKRRKALLEAFGSVEEIKKIAAGGEQDGGDGGADPVKTLMRADGMDRKSAESVVQFFGGK
ncbi:MAG: UvrB/UvrC motif-containing protein, partial [Bacillota bacterium]